MNQKNKFNAFIREVANFSFIGIILLVLFWPILFGHKVFFGGDAALQFYPFFSFFKDNLNGFTFWLSDILSGFPVYLSLVGGFFYFLNIFFYSFLDFISAYHWVTFINFFLGGCFAYFLARNLQLDKTASLIASITYTLSGFLLNYQTAATTTNLYFILPFLFLSLLKISQRNYKYILLGGIALGLGWLSSHLQLFLFIVSAGIFYAFFLDWQNYNREKSFLRNFSVLKSLSVIGILSLLIGSFQILPSNKFSGLSGRALGLSYQEASAGALGPVSLISYLFPYFEIPYFNWGTPGIFYLGFLPFFFFLAAWFYRRENKNIFFFVLLFIFSFLSAIPFSPFFYLMHFLPAFKYFRAPFRWMFIGTFASALLAGYGYQYFLNNSQKIKKIISVFKYLIYLIVLFAVTGNLLFYLAGDKIIDFLKSYFEKNLYQKTTQLPLVHYESLIEKYVLEMFNNIDLKNYKFLIPFGFILFGFYLIGIYYQKRISLDKFKFFVVLTIITNLLLVYKLKDQYIPRQLYLRTSETAEFIKSRENNFNSFRMFSFMPGFSEYERLAVPHTPTLEDLFIFQSEMAAPNLNILYGLSSIDGYDNLMPRRQARVLAELGSDRATLGNKLTDKKNSLEEKIKEFLLRINLLSAQNVKYIISAYQLPTDKLNLVWEKGITRFKIPIYIYENPQVLPRIYFAKEIQFIGLDEIKNFDLLLNPELDFRKTTLIECLKCYVQRKEENNFSKINIEEYRNGLLRLKTETSQPEWLIFGESNLPGWQAKIDGEITDIYMADYLFQAIAAPAGEHFIEFRYRGATKIEHFLFR